MPLPGHLIVLEASLDDAAYTEIDGINNIDWGPMRDLLETTDFKDTTGAKTRLAALKDGSVTLSGDFEEADANGQGRIRAKFDDGATLYLRAKFAPSAGAGSQGFKVATLVESWSISTAVDGKVEWTCTLQFNGVPVAV